MSLNKTKKKYKGKENRKITALLRRKEGSSHGDVCKYVRQHVKNSFYFLSTQLCVLKISNPLPIAGRDSSSRHLLHVSNAAVDVQMAKGRCTYADQHKYKGTEGENAKSKKQKRQPIWNCVASKSGIILETYGSSRNQLLLKIGHYNAICVRNKRAW